MNVFSKIGYDEDDDEDEEKKGKESKGSDADMTYKYECVDGELLFVSVCFVK